MKANPVFSLYIPTKLVFGCGEIKKLSSEKITGEKGTSRHLIRNFHAEIWVSGKSTRPIKTE